MSIFIYIAKSSKWKAAGPLSEAELTQQKYSQLKGSILMVKGGAHSEHSFSLINTRTPSPIT